MEEQRGRLGSRVPFNLPQEDGVIPLLVARVRCALEGSDAAAQARAPPDANLELALPCRKLIDRGSREMLCYRLLARRQHTQNEMPPADESIGAARIVADTPQNQR